MGKFGGGQAHIIGDMLEFFDYFLIGSVLAFIVGPWQLSFGQSAIILLSSGIGAIPGATIWRRLAARIGRRAVFIGTVLNFSLVTGILALTPDHGWIFLTIFRFFVGFGVGWLYCVAIAAILPCFLYLAAWSALAGFAYAFIGFETKGRSIEDIDGGLAAGRHDLPVQAPARKAVGDRQA